VAIIRVRTASGNAEEEGEKEEERIRNCLSVWQLLRHVVDFRQNTSITILTTNAVRISSMQHKQQSRFSLI
jgi:hypothetical protein